MNQNTQKKEAKRVSKRGLVELEEGGEGLNVFSSPSQQLVKMSTQLN